jgi:hypothetical protein
MASITLHADTRRLAEQVKFLKSLLLEAGDVPESLLGQVRGLLDSLDGELTFGRAVSTSRTGEHVVEISFREGGKFDGCVAALRAFRDGKSVHDASV